MPDDKLGIAQRAMLLALMAEAREVSNTELRERWRFTIVGPDRYKLNDRKLVTSVREGNGPFEHELTERGWKWCVDELSADPPDGARPLGNALYAVLSGLSRYLDREGLTLSDIFKAEPGIADVEGRIRSAYRELAEGPNAWVSLTDLRPLLGGAPKSEVDDVLRKMDAVPGVTIVPEDNQRALTAADRAAAVRIGDQDNHLLSIGEA
jgi:hypothetical protein